jgi:hypothetical protein
MNPGAPRADAPDDLSILLVRDLASRRRAVVIVPALACGRWLRIRHSAMQPVERRHGRGR